MPHDRKGQLLEEGDLVMIPAKVLHVYEGEEYCNAEVVTTEVMPPYTEGTQVTLNTKQLEKVEE